MKFVPPLPAVFPFALERVSEHFEGKLALFPIPGPAQSLSVYSHYLTSDEQQQLDMLGSCKRQAAYLAGRICAKEALSSLTGYQYRYHQFVIEKGVFEFPVVRHPAMSRNLQASISHCADLSGAVAFPENHPIGMDIEHLNTHIAGFTEEIITASERQRIREAGGEPTHLYTALWSAKESLSKILRTGLMTPFSVFAIDKIVPTPYGWELYYENFYQYKCVVVMAGKRVIAFALPRKTTLHTDFEQIAYYCSLQELLGKVSLPVPDPGHKQAA